MSYPRYPDGLDWGSIYIGQAIVDALRFQRQPNTDIGAIVRAEQHDRPYTPNRTNTAGPALARTRTGASRYIGVTHDTDRRGPLARSYWRASARIDGKRWNGPGRPNTPEGEYQAACDYAAKMGLPGPMERA